MRGRMLIILGLVVTASGCDRLPLPGSELFARSVPEEGLPYRATLRREGRLDPDFTVTVRARRAGLEQVRESVRYPGTRYCLRTFGTSEITWRASGSPDNWIATPTRSGDLVFRGRCNFR